MNTKLSDLRLHGGEHVANATARERHFAQLRQSRVRSEREEASQPAKPKTVSFASRRQRRRRRAGAHWESFEARARRRLLLGEEGALAPNSVFVHPAEGLGVGKESRGSQHACVGRRVGNLEAGNLEVGELRARHTGRAPWVARRRYAASGPRPPRGAIGARLGRAAPPSD